MATQVKDKVVTAESLKLVNDSLKGSKLDKNQGTQHNGKFMKVGADGNLVPETVPVPDVSGQINNHNTNSSAHTDIRTDVTQLKEALKGFVSKNQGVENKDKILGIGADGVVTPVEKPTGGGVDLDATLASPDKAAPANLVGELKREKADAIITSASGEQIVLADSDNEPFKGLHVYGKSTQVTTTGAQLLNPKSFGADINVEGCTIRSNGDGSIFISKEKTASSVVYELNDITDKLVNGKQYAAGNSIINEKTIITQFVIRRDTDSLYTSTFTYNDSLDKNVRVRIVLTANDVCKGIISPMVNEGSSAKPYEPYTGGKPSPSIEYPQEIVSIGDKGEIGVSVYGGNLIPETQIVDVSFNEKEEPQILTLKTPNGLSGIPVPTGGNYTDSNGKQWVCDEIDLSRGKYVQRVKKIFVNGNCKKEREPSNGLYRVVYIDNSLSDNVTGILCDKLFRSEDLFIERCTQGYGRIYFSIFLNRLKNGENSTEEDLNEFLRENPLTFLCVLKRPIERDLTQEEVETYKALHTNYPTTVIMNDENAGMKVSYVADTKHYIDKKFKELNKAIVNTQISLL